ncbi:MULTISPECIES: OB-fold nucleic acid binding domain-containing protein [Saccharopolyspora]|uniref:OB-fold nucleic acid binding domain-containing protein n=1 Tax=Saccharopolyspora gregorii TaxID=33914 RepID=A0ABP6RTB3_9PSEU|nr:MULTISPECIES: OB-fold nucleic acid binding domain-containing protein [unclassified Saccharopolyspora]MCA1186107.1 OB-fold nucleic acid binding domain-containing protein [Saccharopolyspora sp. 6T]MCA1193133.1 OB-fold nucleic acid binding domain-containing protein [Saccharopolyspora sp. 6V]MCA1224562.1 OB-fold nucleic acid binding domain-containing protein [Saccharopolyspora sp. 6M]MCA1279033.1 OB-fold nucleic acid binding domain-containing protein [Saccharopolyspora sp. 7B]
MSNTGGGYWRRFMRRLTSDVAELDADDLSERAQADGAQRACDCRCGQEAVVLGRLRSVDMSPKNSAPTLEAELFDGTEGVTLVWLGRRRITGIEPGRTIKARGRIAVRDGCKVLYNPYYELQNTA